MMRLLRFAALGLAVIIATASANAQEEAPNAADPPSRVARLSYLAGDVSFQPGGVDDWVTASLNRPLTTSDRLWTARGARAEMQTDDATMRMDAETSFTLAALDDGRAQIQIADGIVNVRLRQLRPEETFEIDTPNFTLNLLRAGEYRIQVDNANDVSWVIVRSGSAEITAGPQAITVQPGQQARFAGANGGTYEVNNAPGPDNFDQWSYGRDKRFESARSAEYVARGTIGYEDLDEYGTWRTYGDYGQVWVPTTTVVGWAPYHYGHWAWIYPWGWTWVDDAPWGFAPFHYGRWVHAGFGWGWVPGPVYVRPVYAPALVAWCGGSGFSVGMSFGAGVGWFPLGPREPYIPWYWGSQRYFSRVNITNTRIVNVNNYYNNYYSPRWRGHDGHDGHEGPHDIRTIAHIDYANRHAPNGVMFVDHDSFVHGGPVSKAAMNVPSDRLRNAPVLTGIDASPDRRSVLGGREDARVRPPQKAFDRPVVSRNAAPKPMPFETQTRNFGNPAMRDAQTRSFADGAGRLQTHVSVTAPRGSATAPQNDRQVGSLPASGDARRVVPRPPTPGATSQQPDRQTNVHVDFGQRAESGNTVRTGATKNPKWGVPRPPDQQRGNAATGEYRNNPAGSPQTREPRQSGPANVRQVPQPSQTQHVSVDRGRTDSAQPVYRPPQQERPVQRTVTPPQGRVSSPQSNEVRRTAPPPQRVERAPEVRQSSPHVERPSQPRAADSGAHAAQRNFSGNQGRRF